MLTLPLIKREHDLRRVIKELLQCGRCTALVYELEINLAVFNMHIKVISQEKKRFNKKKENMADSKT